MSSVSISFSPLAFSHPIESNRKNTSQNPKPKFITKLKSKPKPKSKSSDERLSSTSSIAIEATTYTRLPPRDDFLAPSLVDAYREIKLSDSNIVPKLEENERIRIDQLKNGEKLSGFNYKEYEVPDIVDEFEEEDEDYEEEYDLYEEDGDYVLGEEEGDIVVFGGEGFDEEEEKEKGVPAVMRCFDKAKIYVKAGNGGNGVVAFRREKYVPFGGPSGGDGGRGGNVYVEVDGAMNSLLPFRNCVHFRAGRGAHGQGRNQHGAKGEDLVVKIAPGTVIREARDDGVEGEVLLELLHPGQRALLLSGGRGGRGNAAFKSGMNKVPRIAENGEEGPEM